MDTRSEKPLVFWLKTENQMLKRRKTANRNGHQNRKTEVLEVFRCKNRKTDLKNGRNRKTENPNAPLITMHQLTHSNCRPDRAMNNEDIENVNDRELFSELFDNPIHPLLIQMVPPFVDKKDSMFHLQINGKAIWKWREVYGHPSTVLRYYTVLH